MNADSQTVLAQRRILKTSKRITRGITIIFVLYLLMVFCFFGISLVGISNEIGLVPLASQLLVSILGGFALYIIRGMFLEMSRGKSPFTEAQSKRLMILGVLLLVSVGVDAWSSVNGLFYTSVIPASDSNAQIESGTTIMRFNATMFFSAIGCFCLSYIFKYGSLLQWMYDETV